MKKGQLTWIQKIRVSSSEQWKQSILTLNQLKETSDALI